MRCFGMQPWMTIRGDSTIASVAQSETGWLDLSEHRHVVLWWECTQYPAGSAVISISFETAATKDEAQFVQAVAPTQLVPPVVGVNVVHSDTASNPLARWLRWRVSQTGASPNWTVLFRVWAAVAGGGMARDRF